MNIQRHGKRARFCTGSGLINTELCAETPHLGASRESRVTEPEEQQQGQIPLKAHMLQE